MRKIKTYAQSSDLSRKQHIMELLVKKFKGLSVQSSARGKRLNAGLLRTPGARLLAIRKDMGLTQPQLARAMVKCWNELQAKGVQGEFTKPGNTTISGWETDKREIPREAALIVAELWKTTTDFLLCAPWAESEHRASENNGAPTYLHPEVDAAAAQLDALEPGLRRIVVRRLPFIIDWLRAEWQMQIDRLAEMRAKMVEIMGEEAVKEWEKRQGKSMLGNS